MEVFIEKANEAQFNEYRGESLYEFMLDLGSVKWPAPRALSHGLNFLNPETCHAIYCEDVGCVGYLDFQDLPDVVILQYLIIKPKYRRKGYGEAALRKMCDGVPRSGRKLQSFYYNHNKASRVLHEKLGFKTIGSVVQI